MAMKKVSVTLDADLVAEIKTELGEGRFSAYLNETIRRRRQYERLRRYLRELDDEFGPVPDEVRRQAEREWDEFERRLNEAD
jgi:Arc/MetJ-type ribon-helix-helix transcriptional regulator